MVPDDPLTQKDAEGLSFEWIPGTEPNRLYLCLLEIGDEALVLRRETRFVRSERGVFMKPLWEGRLCCSSKYLRRTIQEFVDLGIWDIRDRNPEPGIMDGEWYVFRMKSKDGRQHTAFLYCPEDSKDRRLRRMIKKVKRLFQFEPDSFPAP